MDELAAMRRRRAESLRAQVQQQQQTQADTQQQFAEIETAVKQYLAPDALQRFGNIKTAHPELAAKVIAVIAQAVQSGQVRSAVADEQLKKLLEQLTKTREIKIKRL